MLLVISHDTNEIAWMHESLIKRPRQPTRKNSQKARERRLKAFDLDSATNIPVFGEHFPSPGVGKFYKAPEGGYKFVPMNEDR